MAAAGDKEPDALKTIGELSEELGVAQHILRYWETKFPQLRPMQRAGNRRYYRPADVDLTRRIHRLLTDEGYTVRGVQKLLRDKNAVSDDVRSPEPIVAAPVNEALSPSFEEPAPPAIDVFRLISIRNRLASAIDI